MAAKIVDQMKEKMKLAGQTALLAEMIPKREGPLDVDPQMRSLSTPIAPSDMIPGQQQDGLVTANLHLPLALRKQRRPNAGFKPYHSFVTKKIKKAVTVKQLKDELRQQQQQQEGKAAVHRPSAVRSLERRRERRKRLKMKKKLKRMGSEHVESFRKKKTIRPILRDGKTTNDSYCWICHKESCMVLCRACPRVYHRECIPEVDINAADSKAWFCPECEIITEAECVDTQSSTLACLSDDDLTKLLLCAWNRMKHSCSGPFLYPVSMDTAPNYLSYIFNPMDLTTLERNIQNKMYGSPDAFLADVKWIAHNCVIYNGSSNKLTKSAQLISQIAEHEIKEMQLCPDCYRFSCSKKKNWFCEPCRNLHTLVWAKLKGFPFWPAKVLQEHDNRLDVRFFGQHDRAWVLVQDCYLISKQMPFPPTNNKTSGLSQAVREVEIHMQKICDQNRKCDYSPFRTPYDVARTYTQRNMQAIKNETGTVSRGKKRKRKGKATYVPVLRDLDPPKPDATIDVENDHNEGSAKVEGKGSSELGQRAENTGIPGAVGGGGDNGAGTHTDEKQSPKDASPSTAEKDVKSETYKAETPTSRFNVSRKVYSKSGKFLALASNITEDARSVVEWSPEGVKGASEKEEVKDSEKAVSVDGKEKEEDGGALLKEELAVTRAVTDANDDSQSSCVSSSREDKRMVNGETAAGVGDKTDEVNTPNIERSPINSTMAPLVLPNKLPDLEKIVVKTENLTPKETTSEGTQMTPQKNDKFNEKLNQTIKSCRKFLGLESGLTEKGMDSDDESVAKSDLDSEMDTSQDEEEDSKLGSDDEETGPSRQVTPSSTLDGDSPRLNLKLSGDFDSDSDENGDSDQELVIDEDAGKSSEAEMSKEDGGKGMQTNAGPLESPKLTIKLLFGSKGKQRATDAGSSHLEVEDDGNVDADKEVREDGKTREEVGGPEVDLATTSGDGDVEEMETDHQGVEESAPSNDNQETGKKVEKMGEVKDEGRVVHKANNGGEDLSRSKMEIEEAEGGMKKNVDIEEKGSASSSQLAIIPIKKSESGETSTRGSNDGSVERVEDDDTGKTKEADQISVREEVSEGDRVIKEVTKGEELSKESDETIIRDILKTLCDKVELRQTEKLERKIAFLEEELSRLKKKNMIQKQEGLEMKANYELMVLEIFDTQDVVLQDKVIKLNKKHEAEMLDVKKKQWCAFCQKESVFFCCWNTSYCDYPCQQKHWAQHQRVCQQAANACSSSSSSGTVPSVTMATTSGVNNLSHLGNQNVNPAQTIPIGQVAQGTPNQVPQGHSNISNLIQYVRFMPMQSNQLLQNLQVPTQTKLPTIQMPSMHPSLPAGNPMPPVQMHTTPQQLRPIGPPFPANPQGPPQAGNVVRQRMPNGNEVILHIPQNVRLSMPT